MAEQRPIRGQCLVVADNAPVVMVPAVEHGRDVTYYFVDDETAAAVLPLSTEDALDAIGAWSDQDWDELADALDRMRHENVPTPPKDDFDDM